MRTTTRLAGLSPPPVGRHSLQPGSHIERTGPRPEVQGYDGKPEYTESGGVQITVLGHGVSVIDLLEHFRWYLLLQLFVVTLLGHGSVRRTRAQDMPRI